MNVLKKVRKKIEYGLARAGIVLIAPLPRRAVVALARGIGSIGYVFSGRLKPVGMANLDLVFGDRLTRAEKVRTLKRCCQTFALVALDIIWFSRNTGERIRRWVRFDQPPASVLRNKSYICATGHLGNWEVLGHASSLSGFPMSSVATPLKNPAVEEIFLKARQAAGQTIIEREGAVRAMLKILRDGGYVGILLDQNAMLTEGGIFVDFFGVPATVSPAAASLAYRTGTEISFGFAIPQPDGSYRVHMPGTITPPAYHRDNSESAIRQLTIDITRMYEKEILQFPECWLWLYKRWKHIRPGDSRDRYPVYSSELSPNLIPASYRKEPHDG